jgi:septal ring factor EnvC (AmiA/AmiB activator)
MPGAMRPIVFFLVSCLLSLPHAAFADDEQVARKKLSTLNKEMKQLRKLSAQFKADRSELQTELSRAETAIGTINRKIRHATKQLKQQQNKLKQLQKKRTKLQKQKSGQQKLIEKQIRAAYQLGQENKLKVLLNQEKPDELNRMLTYYDYFNEARSVEINHYISIIEELNAIEPAIAETTQALRNNKETLDQERQSLVSTQKQRQKSLTKINNSLQNNEQRLQQITSDRRRLEKLLEAVAENIATLTIPNDTPFKALKGKLSWPVKGKLTKRFGTWRTGGKLRWQGVVLSAKEGTEINAVHHGRVLFADWFRGSGLLVIIDHGDGYMSLYAHNQSLLTEPGEWINAGDTIATVGNSGGRKQAGLYFEIRHNGEPSNPQRWFKRS